MKTIKGLYELLDVVKKDGKVPDVLQILYGGTQVRHKLWTVKDVDNKLFHGYGIATLLPTVVEQDLNLDTLRFNSVTSSQFINIVFNISLEDEEDMIKVSTTLDNDVGKRVVTGGDDGYNITGGAGTTEQTEETVESKEEAQGTPESAEGEADSGETEEITGDTESGESQPEGLGVVVLKPDFEYADSLYNEEDKSGSKIKLEEYAREFGVELQRNKTFANMLVDFKSEFGI